MPNEVTHNPDGVVAKESGEKTLSLGDINPNVLKAKYAVRGPIVHKAYEITEQLYNKTKSFPFKKVFYFNVGNPQSLGQTPITFLRQIIASCLFPNLITTNIFPSDVTERAKKILGPKMTVGAYTKSVGMKIVRESVAAFLEKRDDVPSDCEDIFISDGASPAIRNMLQLLISSEKDGVMIPIPQYPIYSSNLSMLGGRAVGYYLDEESAWDLTGNELERAFESAEKKGTRTKAICVINPGNPTGQVLPEATIRSIIDFAYRKKLLIMADEVYQKNVYVEDKKFVSFRKILTEMTKKQSEYKSVSLVSIDTVSKGVFGECGIRGGYIELMNFDEEVKKVYMKMVSMNLCSNITGQIAVQVVTDPPKPSDPSYNLFKKEYETIYNSLKRRAELVYKRLSSLKGVKCQKIEGALYSFPTIVIPEKAVEEASRLSLSPDELYCTNLLEEAGICTVPGTGFKQKDRSYHLRITILPPEEEFEEVFDLFEKFHMEFLSRYD